MPLATASCLPIGVADVPTRAVPAVRVPAVPSATPPVAMPVNPTGMAMEEVTVVTVVTVVTAMVSAMVTATVMTTLRLCRRISRGHHQTGYTYGSQTIDCKQGACRQQARPEFACSTLFVPSHFISVWRV